MRVPWWKGFAIKRLKKIEIEMTISEGFGSEGNEMGK